MGFKKNMEKSYCHIAIADIGLVTNHYGLVIWRISNRQWIMFIFLTGTKPSFNCIPIPSANRCKGRSDGFALPFSNLLISPCAIPVQSNSFFALSHFLFLNQSIANAGSKTSYSFLNSGFFNCLLRKSLNLVIIISSLCSKARFYIFLQVLFCSLVFFEFYWCLKTWK